MYRMGEFLEAAELYSATIGFLEPSYIIQRFLDLRQLEALATYLEALRDKGETGRQVIHRLLSCVKSTCCMDLPGQG